MLPPADAEQAQRPVIGQHEKEHRQQGGCCARVVGQTERVEAKRDQSIGAGRREEVEREATPKVDLEAGYHVRERQHTRPDAEIASQ
jgi:hypothetical protein